MSSIKIAIYTVLPLLATLPPLLVSEKVINSCFQHPRQKEQLKSYMLTMGLVNVVFDSIAGFGSYLALDEVSWDGACKTNE